MIKKHLIFIFTFLVFSFYFLSSPLCQNLYFQPNALEKLEEYGCNLEDVEKDIFRVRTWIY